MTRTSDGRGRERRTDTILPSVLSAREHGCPPSPPDRRSPRRGGGSSPYIESAGGRPAVFARPADARRGVLRSARALAAAALLALSGALALPAQAQMTCTLNTGDLWCGVVTVGAISTEVDGFKAMVGDLSDKTFSVGTGNYTIDQVTVDNSTATNPGSLLFSLTGALTDVDKAKLVLHIGSDMFAFKNAQYFGSVHSYAWSSTGLDWSSETSVMLRLRANNAPVFSPTTATREVAENSAAGTNVGAVIPEATDADSDDMLTYSMAGTDAASFAFDASTRQITTIAGVDYNFEATKNSYEVTVKAADGNGGTATVDVMIDVTDVNEKSTKPDKPTLAAVTGSSTTLTATWTKPELNGGPDIDTYGVQYKVSTANVWTDWTFTGGTATTVTLTGLTANTSYQVQVRALNGETPSDWSDPSDAVSTNADASDPLPPRVTSVVVASAPQSGDTYRSYETIVFTVTFSEPVRVTPGRLRLKVGLDNPGGASGSTVEAVFSGLSQSQRPTADTPQARLARHMHFEYKVQLFDRDEDGVRIGANALRLASGAQITGEGGADAELDHVALGPQSDHKVDGRADVPMIERIEVVSTPRLRSKGTTNRDTYGEGENIRIEVRFDQPVVVEGEPTFALEVGNPCLAVCEAYYESGSGTNTLVFAYLVLEVDIDRNGIAIRGNPIEVVSGDGIRNAADQEAHLSSKGKGTQRGHKVDGSRAAPSHLSVEDAEAHEADGEMEFTVRLEPHGLGIVTVDYATADGSGEQRGAVAGEDYTETSGTLRFNSLETERTVSVPITDDAHEDDGETFTLTLSNPDGAKLRSGEGEATGTIHNSEIQPLTATFEDMPETHDGESAFTFRVAFSEDIGISFRALREDAFTVTGGPCDAGHAGGRPARPVRDDGRAGLGRRRDDRAAGGARVRDVRCDLHQGREPAAVDQRARRRRWRVRRAARGRRS